MIFKGRDATRRSRKIGETQGGRVQGGRSEEKRSRVFSNDIWDQLSELRGPCVVLRENPSRNYFHPCSGDEYLEVLRELPEDVTDSVKAIVLRRLSKLDEARGVEARKRYFCVILNSFPKSLEMPFGRTLSERTSRHYDPWCARWVRRERGWKLVWSVEEIRRYYLYHLFLHEIGHLNQPWRHYTRIRESFAENFALEWARRLGQL
jgi:hypothetical protein